MAIWTSVPLGMLFSSTVVGEWGLPPTIGQAVPVVRSTNITNDGKLDMHDIVYRHVPTERLQPRRIQAGNILVEKSGGGPQQPAGRVAYCEHEIHGTSSNFIEIVRVDKKYDSKFVFYLLHYLYKSGLVLKYQQQTTGIINFKFREYQTECVRVPESKQEQAAIAAILTTVDQAIAQTEALIAKQRRIKAGLLHDLLTRGIDDAGRLRDPATHRFKETAVGLVPVEWEVARLGGIVDRLGGVIQTGPFGSQLHAEEYTHEGVPFIMPQDIAKDGALLLDSAARIPEHRAKGLHRHLVRENDVLFARRGDLSRCAAIAEDGIAVCGSGCMLVRLPSRAMHAEWLAYVYRHDMCQRQILARAVGSTMVNLNSTLLRDLEVVFPNIDEQIRVLEILDHLRKLGSEMEADLSKLHMIKIGLMQDLLAGKVLVT